MAWQGLPPFGPGPVTPPEVAEEAAKVYFLFYAVLLGLMVLGGLWYLILWLWPKRKGK